MPILPTDGGTETLNHMLLTCSTWVLQRDLHLREIFNKTHTIVRHAMYELRRRREDISPRWGDWYGSAEMGHHGASDGDTSDG